jgi:hypothetical protein
VTVLAEVVGEPGMVEGHAYVSVIAGLHAPSATTPGITGTGRMGVLNAAPRGMRGAQPLSALEASMELGTRGDVSVSYANNVRSTLSNYRYDERPTQMDGELNIAHWSVNFGNRVPSMSSSISGPFVEGVGASVRHTAGSLVAEFTATRPATFFEPAAGHLYRGRIGVRKRKVLVAFAASHFGRPAGGYQTAPPVQQAPLSADDQEEYDVEQAFSGPAPSNRVFGAGIEIEFKPTRTQRITSKVGRLDLANAAGQRERGVAGEASYSFAVPEKGTLNLRWRQMPPTLQGIYTQNNERSVDGSVRVAGPLFIVGRIYDNSSETVGRAYRIHGTGVAPGVRFQRGHRRVEARWNYRQSQFSTSSVRRSVSVDGGTPVGPLTLSATADVGTDDAGGAVARMAYYRTDARWSGQTGAMFVGITHADHGSSSSERADFVGSLNVARWEMAGGAWVTRGFSSGGRPGLWTSVGVPAGRDLLLMVGVDRAPIEWTAPPTWRLTFAVRRRFSLPIALRAPTGLPMSSVSSRTGPPPDGVADSRPQ